MKSRLIVPVLFLILCNSCNNRPANYDDKKVTKVSLRQEWFANASYLGEVMAMHETDSLNRLDIELLGGSDDVDPVKMVISGTNDFGVAGCERVFTAQEKGAEIVIIGVVNSINPTCFVAKKDKNILTPKDFEGKRVGVFPGNNTEMVYHTLIKKAGVDVSKIKEVQPSFDLASFIADAYDVRPSYVFDEPVSLDMQNIAYTVIKPQDYGIKFIGNVYFTTRSMIQNKPEIVQAFINSIAKGWELAIQHPEKAVSYLREFDNSLDTKRELLSFLKGMDYFRGENGKLLWVEGSRWKEMGEYLLELKMISSYDLAKTVDTTFVHNYLSKIK